MIDQRPERESIWSIGRKWLPWYLLIVFAMVIGWTAFVAWLETSSGTHSRLADSANAVVRGAATAAPLIPIYALLVVSTLDVLGSVTMVTYRYLSDKFLKPLHERLRQEGRQEGRKEGREEERRKWAAWNQRREEAETKGETFNEPPPSSEEILSQESRKATPEQG